MIRTETASGWSLITHGEHARLAGRFAEAWGNDTFAPPEPRSHILAAVFRHDDGWAARDAAPFITRTGLPEAFTKDLVGTYAAFEEIDLPDYLRVRGEATATVAAHNPYAAIIVSMHTVNLLTEQADLATLRPEHRPLHTAFIAAQLAFQADTAQHTGASPAALDRAFRFLQCCDNLSLIACAGYSLPRTLRHSQPDRAGRLRPLACTPLGDGVFKLSPSPFSEPRSVFTFESRSLTTRIFPDRATYLAALATAPRQTHTVTLVA